MNYVKCTASCSMSSMIVYAFMHTCVHKTYVHSTTMNNIHVQELVPYNAVRSVDIGPSLSPASTVSTYWKALPCPSMFPILSSHDMKSELSKAAA